MRNNSIYVKITEIAAKLSTLYQNRINNDILPKIAAQNTVILAQIRSMVAHIIITLPKLHQKDPKYYQKLPKLYQNYPNWFKIARVTLQSAPITVLTA